MAYGFRTLCLFSPSSGAFTAYRKHKLRASLSDFPFAVRMPVLRTYILCQLSVRAADLDSTFTWPTPGLFQFWSIMIPKLSCKNSLGAPIFRRRIILAGEERRLLAAWPQNLFIMKRKLSEMRASPRRLARSLRGPRGPC